MSLTITAQAVPSVAKSSWDNINKHLAFTEGDWVLLRIGLIHAVCDRVTKEGNTISRVEEFFLIKFFENPPIKASFLDVLELIRKDLASWPSGSVNFFEQILSENPDFPLGKIRTKFTLEELQTKARSGVTNVEPPSRDLKKFYNNSSKNYSLAFWWRF